MGLKQNLASSIVEASFADNPFLSVGDPSKVLASTSTMFVDMTQSFYTASTHGVPLIHTDTQTHDSIGPIAAREGGPIGEMEIDDQGRVTNVIETFSLDQVAQVLMRSVFRLKEKWMSACKEKFVRPSLKTIFLVVDGDSPVAKTETYKKRNTYSKIMTSVERECDKTMSMRRRKKEILAIVKSKMEPVRYEVKEGGGLLVEGSFRRFIRSKENRSIILNHFVSLLTDSVHDFLRDVTIYLCLGHTDKEKGLDQITKLCGDYNHPLFKMLHDRGIPYLEADVAIPYIWTLVKKVEKSACVITKDSDFLVTLLALADPSLHLVWNANVCGGKNHIIYDNLVAVSSKPISCLRNRLDLLLHLTAGGCDFVEGFPSCGKVALMNGYKSLLEERNRVYFPNVEFLWSPDMGEMLTYDVNQVVDSNSLMFRWAKERMASENDVFCVRLGDNVYLVQLDHQQDKTPLEWYTNKCVRQNKTVRECMRRQFEDAMKRRMYFLCNVTETRVCLERDVAKSGEMARKCGYNSDSAYSYENKMLKK